MNRRELTYLREMGEICGKAIGGQICLLWPGHEGRCDRWFPQEKPTREQRLARQVAKLKAQRDRRQRHRESLKQRIAFLERQRARDRGYIGFRIEYRLLGFRNRLRRYWRIVWHRTIGRALGVWPPRADIRP